MKTLVSPPSSISPLWIIFLFFSFTEIVLGVAVFKTTGLAQGWLTGFVIAFPFFVATAFFIFLWNRPENFYAPRDFTSDEAFLKSQAESRASRAKLMNSFASNLERGIEAALSSEELTSDLTLEEKQKVGPKLKAKAAAVSRRVRAEEFITVSLLDACDSLPPLELPIAALENLGDVIDSVYFAITDYVRPYHYGYDWVLRDANTKVFIQNRRMLDGFPPGEACTESRTLGEVGIRAGTALEVVLLNKKKRGPASRIESKA